MPLFERAHRIYWAIRDLPLSLADVPPREYAGLFADFSRRLDAQGDPVVGRGAMSESSSDDGVEDFDYDAPFFPHGSYLPEADLPPCYDPDDDPSGVLLKRVHTRQTLPAKDVPIADLFVPLPMPLAEWRAIWAPST